MNTRMLDYFVGFFRVLVLCGRSFQFFVFLSLHFVIYLQDFRSTSADMMESVCSTLRKGPKEI